MSADPLDKQLVEAVLSQALEMRQHADPGRHHFREFGAGDDGNHARRLLDCVAFDGDDARMCVGRSQKGDVCHAR